MVSVGPSTLYWPTSKVISSQGPRPPGSSRCQSLWKFDATGVRVDLPRPSMGTLSSVEKVLPPPIPDAPRCAGRPASRARWPCLYRDPGADAAYQPTRRPQDWRAAGLTARRPLLMVVEPEGFCRGNGGLVDRHNGQRHISARRLAVGRLKFPANSGWIVRVGPQQLASCAPGRLSAPDNA
jgi:hypothetical protein